MTADAIERFRIRNFRALCDVTFENLTPVTALLGPNGSGKSTVFDALRLLQHTVTGGLASEWEQRGGLAELRSRGESGPIELEVGCRIGDVRHDYLLVLDEREGAPGIAHERLSLEDGTVLVDASWGTGENVELSSPDGSMVDIFGQVKDNKAIEAFREFVSRWRLTTLDVEQMRLGSKTNRTRLSPNGDNLAQVVRVLSGHQRPEWLTILDALRRYVPGLRDVFAHAQGDGRLVVRVVDDRFDEPIAPENISAGTMKLLGYLVALHQPGATVLLLEEPENFVHPKLPYELAENVRASAEHGQVLVATHSPYFVDALTPEEVWVLHRDDEGFTQVRYAADMPKLRAMADEGGLLGNLWMEGYFDVGDPLTRTGRPR